MRLHLCLQQLQAGLQYLPLQGFALRHRHGSVGLRCARANIRITNKASTSSSAMVASGGRRACSVMSSVCAASALGMLPARYRPDPRCCPCHDDAVLVDADSRTRACLPYLALGGRGRGRSSVIRIRCLAGWSQKSSTIPAAASRTIASRTNCQDDKPAILAAMRLNPAWIGLRCRNAYRWAWQSGVRACWAGRIGKAIIITHRWSRHGRGRSAGLRGHGFATRPCASPHGFSPSALNWV